MPPRSVPRKSLLGYRPFFVFIMSTFLQALMKLLISSQVMALQYIAWLCRLHTRARRRLSRADMDTIFEDAPIEVRRRLGEHFCEPSEDG